MGRTLARTGLTILLVLGVFFLTFAAGTWAGGKFLVPPGQGLAGPAEALGYGLLAALVASALAILGSFKLSLRPLGMVTAAVFVPALVLVAALTVLYVNKANEIEATETRQVTAPAVEPPCPLPEGDETPYGHEPCTDN